MIAVFVAALVGFGGMASEGPAEQVFPVIRNVFGEQPALPIAGERETLRFAQPYPGPGEPLLNLLASRLPRAEFTGGGGASDALGILGAENRFRLLLDPAQATDVEELSAESTRLRFDVTGRIVFIDIPIVSVGRRRGVFGFYRGYWKRYGPLDIFYGQGIRVRFQIDGFRFFDWDVLSHYSARTDIEHVDTIHYRSQDIVVECFGLDRPFDRLSPISGTRESTVLSQLQQSFQTYAAEHCYGEVTRVEPILIRLDKETALIYARSPQSPYQPSRIESLRNARPDINLPPPKEESALPR
ncbi:MAG TPA: hypothetical protein VHE55_07985 [Fimbriimonadaceae bacterium]|nr:hypothetical protein [Fimbriimonadaceae bacterium]